MDSDRLTAVDYTIVGGIGIVVCLMILRWVLDTLYTIGG